ncbi:MAG: sialate O-acetylesterase [Bacteroidaceae bacterium]|nr:sialate O-acetylesterase [Bacteroidaceae bacterium]
MLRYFSLSVSLIIALTLTAGDKIRVSCVGNSVTYGYTLPDRERTCYPNQLQQMLGERFEVRNFGHSGATLMRNGHNPYHKLPEYRAAIDFKGEIVVIHLGLNDTDPRNYAQRGEEFIPDYHMLIDSLRAANPSCRMYICLMTPIFEGHKRFLSGTRDWHALIQQDIRRIAKAKNVGLIDLYTPLHRFPNLFPDFLHPNPEGARILAQTVYDAITAHAQTPLSLPAIYQNGMVLQRDAENVLRGRAPEGYEIEVRLDGKRHVTQTDTNGEWQVTLPAKPAGGPYRLTVNGRLKNKAGNLFIAPKQQTLTIDSLFFGEVWLCSGQSNMEWVNNNLPMHLRPQICRSGAADEVDGRVHLYRMQGKCGITTDRRWEDSLLVATNRLQFIRPACWQQATAESVGNFSAIAYRVGRAIADSLGCHVGLIANAIGGSGIEAWVDRESVEWEFPELLISSRPAKCDFLQDWVRRCISMNTDGSADALQRHPFDPCYLYESSILPIEGLTLRGVMWYQGESNAHNLEAYQRLWRLMTTRWNRTFRSADGQPLPFYTMQLASIAGRPSWGRFRDLQRRLALEPNTHLVVTHDVGESRNVHPNRKDIQAARLARTILRGDESPRVVSIFNNKESVVIVFSEPVEGDTEGFEISGEDGIYRPVAATVKDNKVILARGKAECVAVRYAWQDDTRVSLRSVRTGLLVSTFRQDL